MKATWLKQQFPRILATCAIVGTVVITGAPLSAQDKSDEPNPPIVLTDEDFGSVESFVFQPPANHNAAVPPGGRLPDNLNPQPIPPRMQPGAPGSMGPPGGRGIPNDLDSRLADLERRILELARDIRDIRGNRSGPDGQRQT